MAYSVQQIKFEFLSYIKEFGGRGEEWRIGVAQDAGEGLFALNDVDKAHDIWLWKPALSPAAARAVYDYFTGRFRLQPALAVGEGSCVFLFKKVPPSPSERSNLECPPLRSRD